MSEIIARLARFIMRLVLVVAAAVFAAALLVALLILLSIWLLRAGWARLTGRPVTPFVMRMNPRSGFEQVFRGREGMRSEGSAARPQQRDLGDVTDVEPKEPR